MRQGGHLKKAFLRKSVSNEDVNVACFFISIFIDCL